MKTKMLVAAIEIWSGGDRHTLVHADRTPGILRGCLAVRRSKSSERLVAEEAGSGTDSVRPEDEELEVVLYRYN